MRKFAVIVAGGSGSRMGSETPKQFLTLNDEPVLVHTIRAFQEAYSDITIILVLPVDHMDTGKRILDEYLPGVEVKFVKGGITRFDSVKNGIRAAGDDAVIFVHDAVRCLVSVSLIQRCYEKAVETGSAIPVIPVKDSIRRITPEGSEAVNREELRAVQTPQTFIAGILKKAFEQPYQQGFTDEASVIENQGGKITLVEGEETNIKITYPSDLLLAEQFLRNRENFY